MDILGADSSFASLSTADLLEARDLYHWHLLNKKNVVGTAVGLSLIRKSDPWPVGERPDAGGGVRAATRAPVRGERTFDNSEVRDYSRPCILVLVDAWIPADRFGSGAEQESPEELVPSTLYLPDGRTVPVCVVKVTPSAPDASVLPPRTWPASRIGGGFPLVSESQGVQNLGSVGTLVTDGHTVFALTSRHVTGPGGSPVSSFLGGSLSVVGRASARHLTRRPFAEVYPQFSGRRTFATLDVGLVEVDDVTAWTSQGYGLPAAGALADLNELNIGVRLIGARVRAFGAASGELHGRIAALFYRYRSRGGFDDVTDFLIAPDPEAAGDADPGAGESRPGDSGTVWYLVPAGDAPLRPIAVQWGGQGFLGASGAGFDFSLATSLSAILRLLDVELVVDYNTGPQPYWGKTGHYTIATFACERATDAKLRTLLTVNTDRISFSLAGLGHGAIDTTTVQAKRNGGFVPLADVPDLVWKNLPGAVKGGRDTAFRTGPEHPNHFADIDQLLDGTTLRARCVEDPANVSVPVWQDYYTRLGHTEPDKRGLLPFRVQQFFDELVAAVRAKDVVRYVAAAGLVAHYVGDACQPLHGSFLADGLEDGTGKGVHSAYESTMIDRHDVEIVSGIARALDGAALPPLVTSGAEAAVAVVRLMDRSATAIDPRALVSAYAAVATKPGDSTVRVTDALWTAFGPLTIGVLADGALTLAMLWQSAWKAAGGDAAFSSGALTAVDTAALQALYEDPAFVPSLTLDEIGPVLQSAPSSGRSRTSGARRKTAQKKTP
ncbi:S1/P1 Nuclease [Leifsonia sp. 21MFCrub1.1]|uniref:S1/P1 Nuclease n=1 Tax=Leifsonia sp. 21MFCrub1.1 TaxID=1798223 RepID=UPI001E2F5B88|nr:S1/P1 Nuclease [Leifsonia sp. 21MFCrub1.1]